MTTTTYSAVLQGLHSQIIEVESKHTPGLPDLVIIGLATKAVGEAKVRIKSALHHTNFKIKKRKTIVNLAPTDLGKTSPSLDLAMLVSILVTNKIIPPLPKNVLLLGEVGLGGSLKPLPGALMLCHQAQQQGFTEIVIPQENEADVSLLSKGNIFVAASLTAVINHFQGILLPKVICRSKKISLPAKQPFSTISGHHRVKEALTIALAGRHHLLLLGPPGSGKTTLALACQTALPTPDTSEIIAIKAINNLFGDPLLETRPFRAPHHTMSYAGLLGGGPHLHPGEVTLAHGGVLFLDEITAFSRRSLEALRQPMEQKIIKLTHAQKNAHYPADFQLLATANPCPCGYFGSKSRRCSCPPGICERYQSKISGSLLDRFEMVLWTDNQAVVENKSPLLIPNKNVATDKLNLTDFLNHPAIEQKVKTFAIKLQKKSGLSNRTLTNIVHVAQTIAQLENEITIGNKHLKQAFGYRSTLDKAD